MKRDPRLHPLSARRSERRLHGLRLTDGYKLAQRIADTFGLSFRPSYFKRMTQAAAAQQRAQEALIAHLRKTADAVAADLTHQLRRDFALYGEGYVQVSWEDQLGGTHVQRVPPEQVAVYSAPRWPDVELTDAQARLLDDLEVGPS